MKPNQQPERMTGCGHAARAVKQSRAAGPDKAANKAYREAADQVYREVEETFRLYTAWLAVLLKRQGEKEIRVSAEDIRRALTDFSCSVTREEGEYVIRLQDTAAAPAAAVREDGQV